MTIGAQGNLKERILAYAVGRNGVPFGAADLLDLGSQAAVNQALSRMSRSGELKRPSRGTYMLGEQQAVQPVVTSSLPRREIVLSVASRMFAEKGFFGVSIRDIALESGINAATIYHHFPDKVSLYDEVVRIAWDEGARRIRFWGGDTPAREQFEGWISNIIAFHFANSESARIRDREMFLGNWGFIQKNDEILKLTRSNALHLEQIIEEMAPPILKDMPARRVGEMIYGLVYGFIKSMPGIHYVYPDDRMPDVESIKADVLRFITPMMGW